MPLQTRMISVPDDRHIVGSAVSGNPLAWSLWKTQWTPAALGDYTLVVRATDGEGHVQKLDEGRGPFSGTAGLDTVGVRITE